MPRGKRKIVTTSSRVYRAQIINTPTIFLDQSSGRLTNTGDFVERHPFRKAIMPGPEIIILIASRHDLRVDRLDRNGPFPLPLSREVNPPGSRSVTRG